MRPRSQRIVLVVEDDPELRSLYKVTLGSAGYAVVAFEDGLDALRFVEDDDTPAVVILDLDLPRVSGRDVRQELAAHPRTAHIPIIVVSGSDVSDLDRKDFACVITKPINVEALVRAIDNCVNAPAAD